MTVKDLRTVLLLYEDNMEVKLSVDNFVTEIKYIDPCVDMDTNKMSCMITGKEIKRRFVDDFINE